jgi:diguanylate cyclase (GGDEF)-like protein/PAS domain S-box-containing protein
MGYHQAVPGQTAGKPTKIKSLQDEFFKAPVRLTGMASHRSDFSTRITLYFGSLFGAAMAALFLFWYLGWPQMGLLGAGNQRVNEATRALERSADHKRTLITEALRERRGDVLILSESAALAQPPGRHASALQAGLASAWEQLGRAKPDRFSRLVVVDPQTGRVLAASDGRSLGAVFEPQAALQRATRAGVQELIAQLPDGGGSTIAIVRPLLARGAARRPERPVAGILVAYVDAQSLLGQDFDSAPADAGSLEQTALFGSAGELITHSAAQLPSGAAARSDFERTLQETQADGRGQISVYRQLQLSVTERWTLLVYADRSQALGSLKEQLNWLLMAGALLSLLVLLGTRLISQRLTRPLQLLALTARSFGQGRLESRVPESREASREVVELTEAFNGMARSIQHDQHLLEARVETLASTMTASLRASEQKLLNILDGVDACIYLKDLQGKYLFANRQLREIWQVELQEIVGFGDDKFFDAQSSAAIVQNDQRVFLYGETLRCEERNTVAASGNSVVHWSTKMPLRTEDGTVYALCGISVDISARKAIETELQIAASAFESQSGIIVADANWTILRVNQGFTELTGYSAAEALGRQPHELLGSGYQDAGFYAAMAESLNSVNKWQGEVRDRRRDGSLHPVWLIITALRDANQALSHFVVTMMDIAERKAAEEEIRTLAFYDALTGLPNRRLLLDRLGQALTASGRHKHKGALLFLDLDNFKDLNDTRGHDQGDRLLQQVADRLLTCVREGDTVARLGGDEFVVMLQNLSESLDAAANQTEQVGEKILETLNLPYALGNGDYRSTPSIGITLFGQGHESLDELLKRADLAMYQAKAAGRNTLRFFDTQMQTAVSYRAEMEGALRQGLAGQQFALYFQPQVGRDGSIHGAEALVRWQHPQRGLVGPVEFIPLAEDTGVILPLGRWILENACAQLARWAADPQLQRLTLSVNISARQLMRADFVPEVLAILRASGANPQRLMLELTESVLVSDVDSTVGKMKALKAAGLCFALDDFGTGYSSLSLLKLLPLQQLKIDQSFVRDIMVDANDAAIAGMVIALAASLGLEVIAEGVETLEQRDSLAQRGCFCYQGYLFGRPSPLDVFEALVKVPAGA